MVKLPKINITWSWHSLGFEVRPRNSRSTLSTTIPLYHGQIYIYLYSLLPFQTSTSVLATHVVLTELVWIVSTNSNASVISATVEKLVKTKKVSCVKINNIDIHFLVEYNLLLFFKRLRSIFNKVRMIKECQICFDKKKQKKNT